MTSAGAKSVLFFSLTCFAEVAHAGIVSVPQFSGSLAETWEGFPTFFEPPNPTSIMSGAALISAPGMAIYEPGVWEFHLGSAGDAQVSDGTHGMGFNDYDGTGVIEFNDPIVVFGAFWGAATSMFDPTLHEPAMIDVQFFDVFGQLIGNEIFNYSRPHGPEPNAEGDGMLEWHGWSSDIPIKTITYAEDFVVIDGLQANPVPEPAALALILPALFLARRRKRR